MSELPLQRRLWSAVAAGDTTLVRQLVTAGADVNAASDSLGGETPLIRAITEGDVAMVTALIEAGANVDLPSKGPQGWTPLMFAHDNPVMLARLLAAGADVSLGTSLGMTRPPSGDSTLPRGETALHLAAAAGNVAAVRMLLEAGAEVEARTEDGRAPLDYAVQLGAVTEAAVVLVEAGAHLTPERLEAMHTSAHRPDSDLMAFPFSAETTTARGQGGDNQGPGNRAAQPPRTESANGPSEYRCPNCHALIYSRKPKICGQCGELLPPELVLTDSEAQTLADERSWARELAHKFGSRDPAVASLTQRPLSRAGSATTAAGPISAEDLLRRVSCAEEFRHRDRPAFWFYAMGYGLAFSAAVVIPFTLERLPPRYLLFITVSFALLCARAWQVSSPICLSCKQNIRSCPPGFCHVCGEPLRNGRCANCAVDISWTRLLRPYSSRGNLRRIAYCPGCGVHLDAKVGRWRAGG